MGLVLLLSFLPSESPDVVLSLIFAAPSQKL
jgi:hypothetical protein